LSQRQKHILKRLNPNATGQRFCGIVLKGLSLNLSPYKGYTCKNLQIADKIDRDELAIRFRMKILKALTIP
jgi:hypothetical protein